MNKSLHVEILNPRSLGTVLRSATWLSGRILRNVFDSRLETIAFDIEGLEPELAVSKIMVSVKCI